MSDYISREAALDAVFGQFCASSDETEAALNSAVEDIKRIPAADVRPVVRAEFVRCGDGKSVPFMCTHCGKTAPANLVEIWGANYCPNCGAWMEES